MKRGFSLLLYRSKILHLELVDIFLQTRLPLMVKIMSSGDVSAKKTLSLE